MNACVSICQEWGKEIMDDEGPLLIGYVTEGALELAGHDNGHYSLATDKGTLYGISAHFTFVCGGGDDTMVCCSPIVPSSCLCSLSGGRWASPANVQTII